MVQIQETLNQHLERMAFEYTIIGAGGTDFVFLQLFSRDYRGRDVKLNTRFYQAPMLKCAGNIHFCYLTSWYDGSLAMSALLAID
jgi:hypothetical protein